jgi:hypothetical protein
VTAAGATDRRMANSSHRDRRAIERISLSELSRAVFKMAKTPTRSNKENHVRPFAFGVTVVIVGETIEIGLDLLIRNLRRPRPKLIRTLMEKVWVQVVIYIAHKGLASR